MSNDFSASASALGYLFQVRYSLLLLLKSDVHSEISIELIDDITFHKDGTPRELLQAKHSLNNAASLTNSSSELWKTLRIWITYIKDGTIVLDDVVLSIITTGLASGTSAAAKLRPEDSKERDVTGALAILTDVAQESDRNANSAVGKAMAAFLDLSEDDRKALLNKIQILDSSPNIIESRDQILKHLRVSTRPEFLESVYERLEGWWFNIVTKHLASAQATPISYQALLSQINDIQDQFYQDNLPIDFLDVIAPQTDELDENERAFVEQLRLVLVSEPRIQKAVNDYYKAYQQRSQWVREDLIHIAELEKYENSLIDEWERLHLIMKEDIDVADDKSLAEAGRQLYNFIDRDLEINIRPRVTEPYVMRGSYHILSNRLRVGWHKDFLDRLGHLLAPSQEGRT